MKIVKAGAAQPLFRRKIQPVKKISPGGGRSKRVLDAAGNGDVTVASKKSAALGAFLTGKPGDGSGASAEGCSCADDAFELGAAGGKAL